MELLSPEEIHILKLVYVLSNLALKVYNFTIPQQRMRMPIFKQPCQPCTCICLFSHNSTESVHETDLLSPHLTFLLPIKLAIFSEDLLIILIFFFMQNLFIFFAQFLLGVMLYLLQKKNNYVLGINMHVIH